MYPARCDIDSCYLEIILHMFHLSFSSHFLLSNIKRSNMTIPTVYSVSSIWKRRNWKLLHTTNNIYFSWMYCFNTVKTLLRICDKYTLKSYFLYFMWLPLSSLLEIPRFPAGRYYNCFTTFVWQTKSVYVYTTEWRASIKCWIRHTPKDSRWCLISLECFSKYSASQWMWHRELICFLF